MIVSRRDRAALSPAVPGQPAIRSSAAATPSLGSQSLWLVRQRAPAGAAGPLHAHDRDEAVVVLRGAATLTLGDRSERLEAGDLAVVPAGQAHQLEADPEQETEWLIVSDPAIRFLLADGQEHPRPAWAD